VLTCEISGGSSLPTGKKRWLARIQSSTTSIVSAGWPGKRNYVAPESTKSPRGRAVTDGQRE
jgi:hypothetical protein